MKHVTFFRLSLALPLLVPLPFAWLVFGFPQKTLPVILQFPAAIFTLSLVFGGIPYLFFAGYAARWLGHRNLLEIRDRMATAPLRFCLWYFCFILGVCSIYALLSWDTLPLGGVFYGVIGVPAILVLGYFYVFVVKALHTFFHDRNCLTSAPATA